MKQQIISDVMQQMLPYLDNAQMQQLENTLENVLFGCEITVQIEKKDIDDNPKLIDTLFQQSGLKDVQKKR